MASEPADPLGSFICRDCETTPETDRNAALLREATFRASVGRYARTAAAYVANCAVFYQTVL